MLILRICLLVIGLAIVIIGHRFTGLNGLLLMLFGISLLLVSLWSYNKKYQ